MKIKQDKIVESLRRILKKYDGHGDRDDIAP